ncbi:MAG TPA: YcxB family protein [Bauldia sp.]|nr:YcxB family protein [Bauldia sp.]
MIAEVTFRPSPADRAAAVAAMTPPRWGRFERVRFVGAGVALLLLVFFVIARYVWQSYGLFIVTWRDAGAFAFAGAAMGWLYGRRRKPPPDDPSTPLRTVRADRDGLRVSGSGFVTTIAWSAITDIVERDGIILFVTPWQEACFVPRHAFATPEAADAFLRTARAAWTPRRSLDTLTKAAVMEGTP